MFQAFEVVWNVCRTEDVEEWLTIINTFLQHLLGVEKLFGGAFTQRLKKRNKLMNTSKSISIMK